MAITAIKNSGGGSGGAAWEKITLINTTTYTGNTTTFVLPYEVEIKALKVIEGQTYVQLYLNGSYVSGQSYPVGQEVQINQTVNAVSVRYDTKLEVYL